MDSADDKHAATLLRQMYVQLVTDLHHADARPLMNARAMLTLYIDTFSPTLHPERLALLMEISAQLDKAVAAYKRMQHQHHSSTPKKEP